MKIRFIKPFRLYNPIGDDMMMAEGAIENMEKEDYAQWLIDNGFAEKATYGWLYDSCEYYTLGAFCTVSAGWGGSEVDAFRRDCGLAFKTDELAQRFVDYLKAVETVRHDEGFMKQSRKIDYTPCGYGVYCGFGKSLIAGVSDITVYAGEFYFDTYEHAKASIKTHRDEWQTILDYDWSKE